MMGDFTETLGDLIDSLADFLTFGSTGPLRLLVGFLLVVFFGLFLYWVPAAMVKIRQRRLVPLEAVCVGTWRSENVVDHRRFLGYVYSPYSLHQGNWSCWCCTYKGQEYTLSDKPESMWDIDSRQAGDVETLYFCPEDPTRSLMPSSDWKFRSIMGAS
ncbi:hypothetical protein B5F40_06635, partial [Gordonibacter sp. An230]|uniref:hypothetical protein n=1 Tax=Gordonibacter sp. An230 TaxID=1965592 RepID=UPI000B5789C8